MPGADAVAAPCETAEAAHIKGGAAFAPRTAQMDAAIVPRPVRTGAIHASGAVRETVWGGDREDPRLFYFRALLASGRFFGGVKRA